MQALVDTLAMQCAQLRSEVAQLTAQVNNQRAELQYYMVRLPELQSALEKAQQDQRRLNKLNGRCICLTPLGHGDAPVAWCATLMSNGTAWFQPTVREAIDAVPEGVTK